MNFIKNKMMKRSKQRGGITFSDTKMFPINSKYKYIVDQKNGKVIILMSEDEAGNEISWQANAESILGEIKDEKIFSGSVSRKRRGSDSFVPLVDIRNKIASGVFGDSDFLQVSIYEDTVIVEGFQETEEKESADNFLSKAAKKVKDVFTSKKKKIIDINDILKAKKQFAFTMSRKELSNAVGGQISFDAFDWDVSSEFADVKSSSVSTIKQALDDLHIPLQIASFFSGAGVMDQGFKEAGFDIIFALDIEESAVETYRENHGNHILHGDIKNFDKELMKNAPVIIGGPPCQGFSSANRHTNFLDNPNNELVKDYIEAIKANSNCKIFILENVPQILTAGDGKFKKEIYDSLSDFDITSGILSSAQFGCAQDRHRAIFIGSKIGKIELPEPLFTKDQYKTVREAFEGIHEGLPNQKDYSKAKAITEKRMSYVPQGGNWNSIPDEYKTDTMLSGKAHSSIYKRLSEDEASITIVNPRKSNILHPILNRTISVREAARLFGLKDNFIFKGPLAERQQQICNAVPVQLAKAIGGVIKKAIQQFNIRNKTEKFVLV